MRVILLVCLFAALVAAAPRLVLYVTTSAGYRHDSIPVSIQSLQEIGARSGTFTLVPTEDLSRISAESLREFDAVLFFTSGELALSADQRAALLDFIRNGGGFAGFHSATDTLYSWPDYGEMIGGYFAGHPWVQMARVNVEDAAHPVTRGTQSPLGITEEYYQFRIFS